MAEFKLILRFLKKFNFESPATPELFFKPENTRAKMDINIDIQLKSSADNLYMIDLVVTLNSTLESDKVVFKIDLVYSGLAQIEDKLTKEALKKNLLIDIPDILFPDIRTLILNITAASGFPPFQIQAVNFEELYRKSNTKDKPIDNEALPLMMLHSIQAK